MQSIFKMDGEGGSRFASESVAVLAWCCLGLALALAQQIAAEQADADLATACGEDEADSARDAESAGTADRESTLLASVAAAVPDS